MDDKNALFPSRRILDIRSLFLVIQMALMSFSRWTYSNKYLALSEYLVPNQAPNTQSLLFLGNRRNNQQTGNKET